MADSVDIRSTWLALGQRLANFRKAAEFTQHEFAPQIRYGRSSVANVETGHQHADRSFWTRCDEVLDTGGALTSEYDRIMAEQHHLRRLAATQEPFAGPDRTAPIESLHSSGAERTREDRQAEAIRRRVESALGESDVSPAALDDWEYVVAEHGFAARHRPAADFIAGLLMDLDDLQDLLRRRHSASGLRRAAGLTAQMTGLLSLTYLKLNDFPAARRWGRTARTAAAECGDPAVTAWVWAQEAHRYFYSGNPAEAIAAARHGQSVGGTGGGAGAVLAAALEARAHALNGDPDGTRRALGDAEERLGKLAGGDVSSSAFAYDEAQLRFHAGNAFTHLGDTASAWAAQERALELFTSDDYLDVALIHLDRSACVIRDGDLSEGARHIVTVVNGLPADRRDRLILNRAAAIVGPLAAAGHVVPAVREAHELLSLCQTEVRSTRD